MFFQVTNLCKTYQTAPNEITVLDNLSLSLSQGEFLSIVGDSGSGKSTLLQILGTLDHADHGTVMLDGISMLDLDEQGCANIRNSQLGFVYQAHHLIPELTAVENIMLPLMIGGEQTKTAHNKAMILLERLHLSQRAEHIPARLSGGEAQRVAVARALIGTPRLLLADEPTGNLDEDTAQAVFEALRQLCHEEQAAVIMVTHSMALAHKTDRILRLQHGALH